VNTNSGPLPFGNILAPRNRGILVDLIVFGLNLTLMWVITRLSFGLAQEAERKDLFATLAIGLFFGGLLFLQPLGPILKRWSFHERIKLNDDSLAGCLGLFVSMFFYLVVMMMFSGAASVFITEAMLPKVSDGTDIGLFGLLVGFLLSIVNTIIAVRYFLRPKTAPRWKFLTTPRAEQFGDLCMILNIVCFQILWNCMTASAGFREIVTSTPLGKAGSITDIIGRLIVIGVLALLVYFPPRVFYLAEDKHRKVTWLTILLANLPLILRIALAPPH
jgi:hypothetical protein